jgi:hypothetical protein
MNEIHSIVDTCRHCGTATGLFVSGSDLDEEGERVTWFRKERVPHSSLECNKQQALNKEEWPCLF